MLQGKDGTLGWACTTRLASALGRSSCLGLVFTCRELCPHMESGLQPGEGLHGLPGLLGHSICGGSDLTTSTQLAVAKRNGSPGVLLALESTL